MNVQQTSVCRPVQQTEVCWTLGMGVLVLCLFAVSTVSLSAQAPANGNWPETEARLNRQLASDDVEQKRSALFALRNLQTEQASRIAISALSDTNEIVRATAVASVIFLPKTEAITALVPLLDDKADFVRREAAYALGNVSSPEAAAPLLGLFQKEKLLEVRNAIIIALGQSGNQSAIEPLIRLLKISPKEEHEFMRRSVARSIGQIAQIIRAGRSSVITPQNFLPNKFKEVGEATNENFSDRFPVFSAAVVVLSQVLQNKSESDDTRREAAFSIGSIGNKSSVYMLRTLQNSPDPYLAEICKEALVKIEKPE